MNLLNLTNMKYFCDAVRLGGVSAAAKANFVTQSAISQGIAKFEKAVGTPLTARHPNLFRVTPQGDAIYKQATELLQKVSEFEDGISHKRPQDIGKLEFASTYSFVLAVLPPYLKKFRDQYPDTKVYFELGKNHEIKQMLKEGKVDFGIVPDEGDLDEFEKRDIYSGQLKLFASKHVKLDKHHRLGLILAPSKRKETNLIKKALKEACLKKFGREIDVIMEIGSWEVIVSMVADGMGLGFFPDFFGEARKADLQVCNLKLDFPTYCMSAISLKGMKLRKSSEIFLSYFSRHRK